MECLENPNCQVCLAPPQKGKEIAMKCTHVFCEDCLRQYIRVLKLSRELKPQKLQCIHQGCSEEIDDAVILRVFPGEEGFVLKTIRKCYRQSKNPQTVIFCCSGLMRANRKPLVDKTPQMGRQEQTRLTNALVKDIKSGKTACQDVRQCNNIHIYNRGIAARDKFLQCYNCGCSFCINCFEVLHEGPCKIAEPSPMLELKKGGKGDAFEDFMASNQIQRCLNSKCGLPIAKEEGCFWVKCRCSWEMCYPCGKLWGDCQHFSKYPYQKFVPPADWLVKALKLY